MVEFAIDRKLKKKIELMIKRVTDDDENDNYLIIEGDTGSGKTNMSIGIAHEVSKSTGRIFDNTRIFFDTAQAVNYAKTTREQIIIFDEPAFGGLKAEWRKKTQIDLIKLLYTARVKRHFVIFNLVKFSKFSDDIIEKAVGFIRIYKRSETKKERRFLYIPHKRIPYLLEYWHRKHIRAYNKFAVLHGTVFRYVLPEIINKEDYNKMKEDSISMIGNELEKKDKPESLFIRTIKGGIYDIVKQYKLPRKEIIKKLKISNETLSHWNKFAEKPSNDIENTSEIEQIEHLKVV